MRAWLGLMARKLPRSVLCATSPMVPANSTPVGPPPTMTNVISAARSSAIGTALGPLERRENTSSNRRGVLDGFQTRSELFPFGMVKIVMTRAGGDDQRIIRLRGVAEDHETAFEIEVDDLGEQNAGVLLAFEYSAERGGDVGRR